MKICVVGLGIIGGSLCMSLKRAGYSVDGWNRTRSVVEEALKRGVIDNAAEEFSEYDVVFIALPPEATLEFILSAKFKSGAVVSDICGVKGFIESAVFSKKRSFSYVGCHPMAGKETSGLSSACENLFDGANMVIILNERTDLPALKIIKKLTKDMGFKRMVECSAEVHDKKIAYTSQLAHIVSNAYVKDGEINCCAGFTGGSFQDMTRIAGVDEKVWSSLYLKNSNSVCDKISTLVKHLNEIKDAVASGDKAALEGVLARGRTLFEEGRSRLIEDDIKITELY